MLNRGDYKYRTDLVDSTLWSDFQEELSHHLDISIGIYDGGGRPIARPSGEGKLCEILKKSEKWNTLYQKSYEKVMRRALQRGEPCYYKCFTGQCIFVIPVSLDAKSFLFIIGGHLYLPDERSAELKHLSDKLGIEASILREIEGGTRTISLKEFFGKLRVVKKLAVPFLKSLWQKNYFKGYFEKECSQMKTMARILTKSGFPESENELYRNVFNTLCVLFDIDGASVMELNENQDYKSVATFGLYGDTILSRDAIDISTELKSIIKNHEAHYIDRPFDLENLGFGRGISSVFIFPITIENEQLGLLCIYNTELDEESVKLISLFTGQVAVILKSFRMQQVTLRKIKVFDFITDIHQKVASASNIEELFDLIMNKAVELVRAEQGSLMLVEGKDQILSVKASKGIDKSILESVTHRVGEGISGRVAKAGEAMVVNDIEHQALKRKNRSRYKTKSFLSLPLKVDARTIGVINISDKISGEIFSEEDLQTLLSFASYASIALERGAYFEMTKELKEISSTDSLTGLMNRGSFHERFIENIERSRRYGETLTVFMIDIDDFKVLNDKCGHLAGDEALKKVAHAVKDGVRTIDIVGRVGGEELCVVLPNTRIEDSYVIAERMRRNIEMITFMEGRIPEGVSISVSIGIAEYPAHGETSDDILHCADMAMYTAKKEGKNRVVVYKRRKVGDETGSTPQRIFGDGS